MLIYIDGMREKTFAAMASSVLLLSASKSSTGHLRPGTGPLLLQGVGASCLGSRQEPFLICSYIWMRYRFCAILKSSERVGV
jgi:hypothetical protein